uniref:Uncharacterized protein n=1 Tax=viral metagenome TaxID=1070528 RepID=A0A6C0D6Z0_9ZZZZ
MRETCRISPLQEKRLYLLKNKIYKTKAYTYSCNVNITLRIRYENIEKIQDKISKEY